MMSDYSRRPTEKNVEAHCGECGREFYRFYTATHQRFCPDCQRERTLEKQRNQYVKHDRIVDGNRFKVMKQICTVIHDPLPDVEGGFRPGAKLYICEINDMLKLGYIQPGFTFEQEGERRIIE